MTISATHQRHTVSSERIPQLDGVRGIAILLVLIYHYIAGTIDPQASPASNFIARCLNLTWSGVDLFFVLSGFLIGGILLDNRRAANFFKVFYVRRIYRIFPLYFAWLFLFVICALIAVTRTSAEPVRRLFEGPIPFWSYATFTQNISMAQTGTFGSDWLGITWSLAIEEQFYLILPAMIYFAAPRKLPYLLVALIVIAPMLRLLLLLIPSRSAFPGFVLLPCRADALLLGVLGAYIVRRQDMARYLSNHIKWLYGLFLVFLSGTVLLTLAWPEIFSEAMTSFGYSWLAGLYFCFILIAVTEKHGMITRLTTNAALCRLGILAYGVYIFHQAINGLSHALILNQVPRLDTLSDILVTGVSFSLTILLAWSSWNFFEKRLVVRGHAFKYKAIAEVGLD